jgi:hypothetical protein
MRDRNPYVVLGLEFGSSREAANVAFARRARPLKKLARTNDHARDLLIELTWALNQIDEAITSPETSFDFYRVPADANAFSPAGHGLFSPPPELLDRRYERNGEDVEALTDRALRELLVVMTVVYSQDRPLPEP